MNNQIHIGSRTVGPDCPPFIIAEMSGNHNQSLDRALEIVDQAAASGAHALKLQTYTADSITLNLDTSDFQISDVASPWHGANLHSLYSQAYTPWEWHAPLFKRARAHGLICFSSPFDISAIDFLETLDVPAYKIASFENNHLPLIERAASTGKPLLISTGMASLEDLDKAVTTARRSGCNDLILLKCTSTYPASPVNCNIRTLSALSNIFDCQVGLSDHTMGVGASVASVALGATVIEKHFTLSRSDGGVDSTFSLEPYEFRSLVDETFVAWQSLGKIKFGPSNDEKKSFSLRRSIYTSTDINEGDPFTPSNIKIVRPGFGAPPSLYKQILGKTARKSFKAGSPLTLDDLLS